jgi:fused signal recognition particle receptor
MVFGLSKKKKNADKQEQVASTPVINQEEKPKQSWLKRLSSGLKKTRQGFSGQLGSLFLGRKSIDDELFEELETILLTADVGSETTEAILAELTEQVGRKELKDPAALQDSLQSILCNLLKPCEQPLEVAGSPFVILMVGINGAGKTTSIAKLAHHYKQQGKQIMLAAGDTFRAAAVEQLQVWGDRNNVPVVAQKTGSDSASVAYDALASANAKQVDLLITDTAGRLHTQHHLMDELKKIKRVMKKQVESAPHETLLVIDAGNGQNALQQAKQFHEAIGVTGIAVTKLDGTAKGGIVFAIAKQLGLPIRFIGVGEAIDDLKPFKADEFIQALFE